MNQLAKLYLDEDVSAVLGKILTGRGFDVLTARDGGMLRKSDEEQLIFATGQTRVALDRQVSFSSTGPPTGVAYADHQDIIRFP